MNPLASGPPFGGMPPKKGPSIQRQLEQILDTLPEAEQQSVLSFAQFLQSQQPDINQVSQMPVDIERPDEESVVAAIRRLSKSYPMVDKQSIFDRTSAVMTGHIMQEVSAQESIDQLEQLFFEAYEAL